MSSTDLQIQHEKDEQTKRYLKILSVVASIVGIIAFAFAVVTYVQNRNLEEARNQRTEAFVQATNKFTETLNQKEEELKTVTSSAQQQADRLDAVEKQLQTLASRVESGNALIERIASRDSTL